MADSIKDNLDRLSNLIVESTKEFNRHLEESRRRSEESRREFEEYRKQSEWEMAVLRKDMGGIDNIQGEIAEDFFRRNVLAAFERLGMHMDSVFHNLKVPGFRQYDVTVVNGTQVVVFEIKNKLRRDDITRFLETQLPQFKEAFPQFKDHKVYGGVGAVVMSREQEAEAIAKGLFVLTEDMDGIPHIQGPKTPLSCRAPSALTCG